MSILTSSAVVFGIIIGLIICVVIFKLANTDKRVMTKYDERQEAIRGKAYTYAFYTGIILEAINMSLEVGKIKLPLADYLVDFFIIMASMTVLGVYCVWKGAYWGLNNNRKSYIRVLIAAVILNIIPVISVIVKGNLALEGSDSLPMLNIMVLIMLAIVAVAALIKKSLDSREDE